MVRAQAGRRVAALHTCLPAQFRAKKGPASRPKTPKGRYVNPANPDQAYELGRGRPPRWFSDLEASGRLPEPESTDAS